MLDQDTIFITGIACDCVIGLEDWEREVRQRVLIDLEFPYTWRTSAVHDLPDAMIDYKVLAKGVVALVGKTQFRLIEALAETVADFCLREFRLAWVRVALTKPGALSDAKTVGVCLRRGAPERVGR